MAVLSRAAGIVPDASSTPDLGEEPNEKAENVQMPMEPAYSFERYMERPAVQENLLGMTARVAKILRKTDGSFPDPAKGGASERERQQWRMERLALEDELREVKDQLLKYTSGHGFRHSASSIPIPEYIADMPSRLADPDSEATEIALLRKENYELRNMTREEKQTKAREIMLKLRGEIDTLKVENASLRSHLDAFVKRKDEQLNLRPPKDVVASIKSYPFEISAIDRERVYEALEEEWKTSAALSRHGGADPIRNPFQRRS